MKKYYFASGKSLLYNENRRDGYVQIPPILWVFTILIFFIVFPLHIYGDILITAKHGYIFWDLLLDGKLFDFYFVANGMTTGNIYFPQEFQAAYVFPVYFVFAIWNLPTWIIGKISGIDYFNTIPSMIWMKMILIPFIIISTIMVFRIFQKSEYKKYAYYASFLFFSSILVIYPTAIIGQYDILGIPLILWGIDSWMERKDKTFIVAFSLAVLFKYFALLYFLPLLLLRNKTLKKILIDILLVCAPSVIFYVFFPKPIGNWNNLNLISLFLKGIKVDGEVSLYLFASIFSFVLLYLYFKPLKEEGEYELGFFSLFVIMASFCIFANPFPYWVILAEPAFILGIFFCRKNLNKLVLMETAISWGITVKNYIIYHWCFSVKTTGGMGVLHRILDVDAPNPSESYSVLLRFTSSPTVNSFVFTALFVGFITMICFSCPRSKQNDMWEPINNGTIYLRTFGNIALTFLPVVYIVYKMLR